MWENIFRTRRHAVMLLVLSDSQTSFNLQWYKREKSSKSSHLRGCKQRIFDIFARWWWCKCVVISAPLHSVECVPSPRPKCPLNIHQIVPKDTKLCLIFYYLFFLIQDPCFIPREINKTIKKLLENAWIRPIFQILTKSDRGLFSAWDPSLFPVSWKYVQQNQRKPADKPTDKWTRVKTKMFVSTQLAKDIC